MTLLTVILIWLCLGALLAALCILAGCQHNRRTRG
jgi:outer membrane murein-binding lipoprotein Lpp